MVYISNHIFCIQQKKDSKKYKPLILDDGCLRSFKKINTNGTKKFKLLPFMI